MTPSIGLVPRYLSPRESAIKADSLSYFVDLSEKYVYILGMVTAVDGEEVTVKVVDVGAFSEVGKGTPPLPVVRQDGVKKVLEPGDLYTLDTTAWVPHTPTQFADLKEKVEAAESFTSRPLGAREVANAPEKDEDVEDIVLDEPELEDVDEGAPEIDIDVEGSLFALAGLQSWARDRIVWPEGYPLPWMSDAYEALPEGVVELPSGPGLTDKGDAPPTIISPGNKGLMPKDLADAEKAKRDLTESGKKIADLISQIAEQETRLDKFPDESESIKKLIKSLNRELENAQGRWEHANKRYIKFRSPDPEKAKYSPYPGKHHSREGATGKQMLRQDLEHLSDQYEKTLKLYEEYHKAVQDADEASKELTLALDVGHKRLIEEKPGEYVIVQNRAVKPSYKASEKALEDLETLKKQQFCRLPYVGTSDENASYVKSFENLERVLPPAYSKYLKGKKLTFNDLPFVFVRHHVQNEEEKEQGNPPLKPVEILNRAEKAAADYVRHIKKFIGYKHPWKVISAYILKKYDAKISQEDAQRLALIRYKPDIKLKINVIKDDKLVPLEVSGGEVAEALSEISADFRDRVLWLKELQKGLDARAEALAHTLRRNLVDRDLGLEKQFKNEVISFPALINNLDSFARKWDKTNDRQELLGSEWYARIAQGVTRLNSFLNKIKDDEDLGDLLNKKKIDEAVELADTAVKSLNANKFPEVAAALDRLYPIFKILYDTPPLNEERYKEAIVDVFKKALKTGIAAPESIAPSKYEIFHGAIGPEGSSAKQKEFSALGKKMEELRGEISKVNKDIEDMYIPAYASHSGTLLELERGGRYDLETSSAEYEKIKEEATHQIRPIDEQLGQLHTQISWLKTHSNVGERAREHMENSLASLTKAVSSLFQKKKEVLDRFFKSVRADAQAKKRVEDAYRKEVEAFEKSGRRSKDLKKTLDGLERELSAVKDKWNRIAIDLEISLDPEKQKEKKDEY